MGILKESFETVLARDFHCTNVSDYLNHVRLYQRTFPPDRFLFLRFEDLRHNLEQVADQYLRFLELPTNHNSLATDASKHASYQAGRLARWLIHATRQRPIVNTLQNRVWTAIPPALQYRLRGVLTKPVPQMSQNERAERIARE